MQRHIVLTAALAALLPSPAPADAAQPVRVYVFARAQEPVSEADKKTREKQAEAERKSAEQAAKALDKTLAASHGKKAKDWPEEARQQSEQAWQKALAADLARVTVKFDEDLGNFAKSLADTLRDTLKKSTTVAVSESADQAELTVELLARSARTSFPAAAWLLYLKLTPTGSAAAAATSDPQFAQVGEKKLGVGLLAAETVRGAAAVVHPYTAAEPYWTIRVFQQGHGYHTVVATAAEVLAAFASELATPGEKAAMEE